MINKKDSKGFIQRTLSNGNLSLYSMLIPGLAFFFVLCYIPMLYIIVAFLDYKAGFGIFASKFVGFKYFTQILSDHYFLPVLRNTLLINMYKIGFGTPVPIILALALYEMRDSAFKRVIQSTIYLPHFLSWVVVSGLMISLFSVSNGIFNRMLVDLGLEPVVFLGSGKLYRSYLVISEIWKEAGWGSIIYLAALMGIDSELYDAARVDGASKLRQIWHVSLPGISNTIVILVLLSIGGILTNSFEQVFVTINPAVYDVGEIISTYVYHKGIEQFKISYATAVGLFQSIIGFGLVLATNNFAKKMGGNSLW